MSEPKTDRDLANEIINQKGHTEDDITELQRIKRRLSLLYSDYCRLAGEQEHNYDVTRTTEYIAAKQYVKSDNKHLTDSAAVEISRQKAVEKYGNYKINKAKADGMKAVIAAIKEFCIDYYTKRNSELSASMGTKV